MIAWSTCIICYTILAVELTLAWNRIEGVYEVNSTGQFIPLLIGLLGLGRSVVSAFLTRSIPIRKVFIPGSHSLRTANPSSSLLSMLQVLKDRTRLQGFSIVLALGVKLYSQLVSRKEDTVSPMQIGGRRDQRCRNAPSHTL